MKYMMKTMYEIIMILLVILTIFTIWAEQPYHSTINWVVWFIFVVDFLVRFIMSKEKWTFVKKNPFLLIAIIPFDQFFQVARIVRVIYLFRLKTITKYYITPYMNKWTYQSLTLLLSFLLSLLMLESYFVWKLENTVTTFINAMYVTFGHLLFFGHEINVIENKVLIFGLTCTSIIGLILQGLALQWAFTKGELLFKKTQKYDVE